MPPTAAELVVQLRTLATPEDAQQLARYFKTGPGEYGEGDHFLGVRMGTVFAVARANLGLSIATLEELLDSDIHEVRALALTSMNEEAKRKKTSEERRRDLYELYLRKHDRIDNWDLVDVACRYVVGAYLFDKPRDPLYALARSRSLWERRTAIVSTWYFIRAGQTDDAVAIAELLLRDHEDLIHKATGWMLRYIGDIDRPVLVAFLERHAATMPRTALRYALEKFPTEQRRHWMGMRAVAAELNNANA